jgi:hypothetical protein
MLLFFESVTCTRCGHALAYLPDRALVSAIERVGTGDAWRPVSAAASAREVLYRLCGNYTDHAVCNWAFPATDEAEYCVACRLNHIIPNLGSPGGKEAWHRLEAAKRRVLYTLFQLGLPVEPKDDSHPNGLGFEFLADAPSAEVPKVLTAHNNGLITINIAEAQSSFREKMREQMSEAYRTVLGHFRHEIGHYYWDRLIKDGPHLADFRNHFGDERADYDEASKRHYQNGAPADWASHFVSAYASMHPWEDWAETWAHYLHMVDTTETAHAYGLSLEPTIGKGRPLDQISMRRIDLHSFDDLLNGWVPLTIALNSLNRSMGAQDPYPFVLSEITIGKLRFVDRVVRDRAGEGAKEACGAILRARANDVLASSSPERTQQDAPSAE